MRNEGSNLPFHTLPLCTFSRVAFLLLERDLSDSCIVLNERLLKKDAKERTKSFNVNVLNIT